MLSRDSSPETGAGGGIRQRERTRHISSNGTKYYGEPSPTSHPSYYIPKSARGIFVVWITIASTLLCAAILVPAALLGHVHRQWSARLIRQTERLFGANLGAVMYYFAGSKLIIHYDAEDKKYLETNEARKENTIAIANHQLYCDWVYLWNVAQIFDRHGDVKITLKYALRHVPIIGWGMHKIDFLFLKRNWVEDKPALEAQLSRLESLDLPYWLLIFPEGTTYCQNTFEISQAHHTTNFPNEPHPKHILTPRSTGLHACTLNLKKLKTIWDITVFYPGTTGTHMGVSSEEIFSIPNTFWKGSATPEAHIFIRRIPIEEVPTISREAFDAWLKLRWQKKDDLLSALYAQKDSQSWLDAARRGSFASSIQKQETMKPSLWHLILIVGICWIGWSMLFLPYVLYLIPATILRAIWHLLLFIFSS